MANMTHVTGGVAAVFALVSWFAGSPTTAERPALAEALAPQAPASAKGDDEPDDGVVVGDRFEVHYLFRISQGELGSAPEYLTDQEDRYTVEVLERRGEQVRVRVTHADGATQVHQTTPARLALIGLRDAGGLRGLAPADAARRDGERWTRRGEVSLLGVPVPVAQTLRCSARGDAREITLTGGGRAAVADTGLEVELTQAGTTRFDPQRPGWPTRIEAEHRCEVRGGGAPPVVSRVELELDCRPTWEPRS